MKIRISSIGMFFLLVLVSTAWTADFSGKWVGSADDVDITLVFKVDGGKATGTINNPLQPGDVPLKNVTINGNEISFNLERTINENEIKILWKGKISGDTINFTREIIGVEGSSVDIAAKRVK